MGDRFGGPLLFYSAGIAIDETVSAKHKKPDVIAADLVNENEQPSAQSRRLLVFQTNYFPNRYLKSLYPNVTIFRVVPSDLRA